MLMALFHALESGCIYNIHTCVIQSFCHALLYGVCKKIILTTLCYRCCHSWLQSEYVRPRPLSHQNSDIPPQPGEPIHEAIPLSFYRTHCAQVLVKDHNSTLIHKVSCFFRPLEAVPLTPNLHGVQLNSPKASFKTQRLICTAPVQIVVFFLFTSGCVLSLTKQTDRFHQC